MHKEARYDLTTSRDLDGEVAHLCELREGMLSDISLGDEITVSDSMRLWKIETPPEVSAARIELAAGACDAGGVNTECVEVVQAVSGEGALYKRLPDGSEERFDLTPERPVVVLPGEKYSFINNDQDQPLLIDAFYSPAYTDEQKISSEDGQDDSDLQPEIHSTSEHEHREASFAIRLQDRLQQLAERDPETEFSTGFTTQFEENGLGFEVSVMSAPARRQQMVAFAYGGIHGTLAVRDGQAQDIFSTTYDNPEAHLVDWQQIASDESAPLAVRMIATRMKELIDNRKLAGTLDKSRVKKVISGIWDTVREIGAPVTYSYDGRYNTHLGRVTVISAGDLSSRTPEGEERFLPDDEKQIQLVNIRGAGFTYKRNIRNGQLSEAYDEDIDLDTLPPLTDEERKRHPYVVITAEQGRPQRGDESWSIDFDTDSNPVEIQYPTHGYTVISARPGGGVTITVQTWHATEEEAQQTADRWYQMELASARQNPEDITPERQKRVLDTLDAALLVTDLE